jgi:hypothetical protein
VGRRSGPSQAGYLARAVALIVVVLLAFLGLRLLSRGDDADVRQGPAVVAEAVEQTDTRPPEVPLEPGVAPAEPEQAAAAAPAEQTAPAPRRPRGRGDDEEEAPGPARFVGRVVRVVPGGTDEGVAGAIVLATPWGRRSPDGKGLTTVRAETDPLGRFALDVQSGAWLLTAEVAGHSAAREGARVRAGATEEVEVRVLAARSTLTGQVVGPDGRPLGAATVAIERDGRVSAEREATTGPDGLFRFEALPEGLFSIEARAEGYVTGHAESVAVTEEHGGEARLQLALAARLEGTLRGPDGRPIAGRVFLYPAASQGQQRQELEVDEEGRFAAAGLSAGALELFARTEDLTLSARLETTLVAGGLSVVDVRLAPGRTVSGRVVDPDGTTRAGLVVVAQAIGGAARRDGQSDADGAYVVSNLYPGRYEVVAYDGDGEREEPVVVAKGEVDVTTGPASLDLVARPGARVAGQVVREDGTPLEDVSVVASRQDGADDEEAQASTDEAGRFLLRGLTGGSYALFARDRASGLVVREPLELREGATLDGLRLVVRPPAKLAGRVLDPEGKPVRGLDVTGRCGPAWRQATTDEAGRFVLEPLYDGEWEVAADSDSLLLVARRRGVPRVGVDGLRVAVRGGRDAACELRLQVQ